MTGRKGAFFTGKYRNILKEFGFSEEKIKKKVKDTWNKLFFDEEIKFYHPVGDDMGYITDTGNNDVRTEGMSYGMMMAVQMGEKEIFDRIWKWTKKYMQHDSGQYKGYFAWSCNLDGSRRFQGPAPDGEEYFALALFFASNRWGDGDELFNYSKQAKNILYEVIHKGEGDNIGEPMWNRNNKLIKFTPESDFTDPSYHLPHFYELFARWGNPEDREFWLDAAKASRDYLKKACHPETGLCAEYAHYDGTPVEVRGHQYFYSDAYRVALNIGLDYEWFKADEWQCEEAERIQSFFRDKEKFTKYTLEGEELEMPDYMHHIALISANAASALASDGLTAKECVKRFWKTPLRRDKRRYYDNCLYFFSLLALSGKYRVW